MCYDIVMRTKVLMRLIAFNLLCVRNDVLNKNDFENKRNSFKNMWPMMLYLLRYVINDIVVMALLLW
jgi:hypothetical protein